MEDLKLNKRPSSPEFESFYDMMSVVQHDLEGELDDVFWWEDVYEMSQLKASVYAVTGGIAWSINNVCDDKQL